MDGDIIGPLRAGGLLCLSQLDRVHAVFSQGLDGVSEMSMHISLTTQPASTGAR